jgi:hypothetical protein
VPQGVGVQVPPLATQQNPTLNIQQAILRLEALRPNIAIILRVAFYSRESTLWPLSLFCGFDFLCTENRLYSPLAMNIVSAGADPVSRRLS